MWRAAGCCVWLQGWCVLPQGSRVCIEKGRRRGLLFKMRTPPQSKARPGWRAEVGIFEMHQGWWDPKLCSRGWGGKGGRGSPCAPLCFCLGVSGGLASPKQALISVQPLSLKSFSMPGFS